VVVAIACVTVPLVYLQRYLLRRAERYVTVGGRGSQSRPLRLGRWRWLALAAIALWFLIAIGLPLAGVLLRAFVSRWGEGINPFATLTLRNFRDLAEHPNLVGGIVNTFLLATVGAAASVAIYALIALATHRWQSRFVAVVDYLVLLPRSLPGLVAGLAFLWVFLFVPYLGVLRSSLVGIWLAYSVVWLAFGLRLISAALAQIAPELEEAARITARRDAAAHPLRAGELLAALLHDLRARVFDRRLSAGTGHRSAGAANRVAVRRRLARIGGGAVARERRSGRRRPRAGAAARRAHLADVLADSFSTLLEALSPQV
jgi:ABC-type Fe3+ transport system permease subunit